MYEAKDSLVRGAQLRTQELVLPYTYVGNATPASVVVTVQDPSILFIETESTSAVGTSDISALITSGETYTPADVSDDSDGEYNMLVRIKEKVKKVLSVECRNRQTGAVIPAKFTTAPSNSIISFETADADDCMCFTIDHGADLTAATVDAVLVIKYQVE